ncbi:hypothetical protein E4U55_005306 [Claviceps digitariae]|nr:hypothetical protein E4U55_005306 [Claviceps digitariae]
MSLGKVSSYQRLQVEEQKMMSRMLILPGKTAAAAPQRRGRKLLTAESVRSRKKICFGTSSEDDTTMSDPSCPFSNAVPV